MAMSAPDRREHLRRAGRLGGLAKWIRHPVAPPNLMDNAHHAFRQSFMHGHSCKLCPEVVVDPSLSDAQRRKVADRLRRQHFRRMSDAAVAKRRADG